MAARNNKEEPLWGAHNKNYSKGSLDINDVGSGFVLEKSLISHSVFGVVFRPGTSPESTQKVAQIMSCGVLATNL